MVIRAKIRSLAAASIISMIVLISVPTISWAETSYTPSTWAAEKVSICNKAGIIPAGFDSMPYNGNITRRDFFELIINTCRLYGVKLPEISEPYHFTDTQDTSAEYAYKLGLTQGTAPGIFGPDEPLTREMASVVLSRIRMLFEHTATEVYKEADRNGYDNGGYGNDGDNSSGYGSGGYNNDGYDNGDYGNGGYMFDRGGYNGRRREYYDWWYQEPTFVYETQDGTLAYASPMDEWQADRLLNKYSADSDEVSDWAKASMADVYSSGLITGMGGGSLVPKGNITREQAAIMSLNVLAYNDVSKLKEIGIDECVIPAPAAIYISLSYSKYDALLNWNEIPAAAAYDITVFNDGEPAYSTRVNSNYLDMSEGSPESLYGSIFGNESRTVRSALQVIPVDSEGKPSIFSMKKDFSLYPWRNLNELITGNPEMSQFGSKAAADQNMIQVTVKVWDLNKSGEKITASRTLTVNKNVADDVKSIFEEIYNGKEKFPIKNISAYSYRDGKSQHSNGTAIDINPNENYFLLSNGKISAGSFWKPGENPYSIKPGGDVVRAFNKYGWHWSPDMKWPNGKDYMHFSLLGI